MHTLRLLAHAALTCALILGGAVIALLAAWMVIKALASPFKLAAWMQRKRRED